MSSSSSSSSSLSSSMSFLTLSDPLSPKKTTVSKDKEMAALFATKAPKIVLDELHLKGFDIINECRCIPQLSRQKDEPKGNPDVRELIETEVPNLIAKKMTQTDQPLTVCSVASAPGFEDLTMLSKLHDKGFKDISWILVDPAYSKSTPFYTKKESVKLLSQFKEIAELISPGIKIQTLASTSQITTSKLIGNPDVYLDFDDGLMGQKTLSRYKVMLKQFEKHIHSSTKPIIYLHSDETLTSLSFYEQSQSIMNNVNIKVTLSYISPDQVVPEKQMLVDSTFPTKAHNPDLRTYKYFLEEDDYDAVKFCIEKGMSPTFRDEEDYTILMSVVEHEKHNSMRALVEIGHADVNETGSEGMSPMHCAAISGSPQESISYLVAHGADINMRDENGMTPLILAAENGNVLGIRVLVALGARLDIRDTSGNTALATFKNEIINKPGAYNKQLRTEIFDLLTPKPVSTKTTS